MVSNIPKLASLVVGFKFLLNETSFALRRSPFAKPSQFNPVSQSQTTNSEQRLS
jgi:hypothetical protein